jgi:hypothetical protein
VDIGTSLPKRGRRAEENPEYPPPVPRWQRFI